MRVSPQAHCRVAAIANSLVNLCGNQRVVSRPFPTNDKILTTATSLSVSSNHSLFLPILPSSSSIIAPPTVSSPTTKPRPPSAFFACLAHSRNLFPSSSCWHKTSRKSTRCPASRQARETCQSPIRARGGTKRLDWKIRTLYSPVSSMMS